MASKHLQRAQRRAASYQRTSASRKTRLTLVAFRPAPANSEPLASRDRPTDSSGEGLR